MKKIKIIEIIALITVSALLLTRLIYSMKFNDGTEMPLECCEGCMCGDTLKLIKNTQTAWNLTTIDENGEYIIDYNSFINFHGTGKNKFAFFKNDEEGNTLSEIKGELSFKGKNIILRPDNSNKKITCKIGEEKDLLAIIECDNNFGKFTLQKEGKLDIPTSMKETLSKTKKIEVTRNNTRTITDETEINNFIEIVNKAKIWTGSTTLPSSMYHIELFDENNDMIAEIEYNEEHFFFITINNKQYDLVKIDKWKMKDILEKEN